ncbi:unnamed protein product [Camellia sinensis]
MGKDTLRWHVLTCPLRSPVAPAAAEEGKRRQRIAPAAIQGQWPKVPESEMPPEPWCGVYHSPRSPNHHHRFQESKSANCLLRRQCSEQ